MSDEQTAATEAATDQTMADIAGEIKIPDESAGEQKTESKNKPDNVSDFEQFAQKLNTLTEKVETTAQKADQLANSQQEEVLKQEIAEAVAKINENVGGDETMAELYLDKMAREDPNFKKVVANRHENPEAFSKALDVLGKEWAAKNQTVIDPTVAENQRALRASQQAGSSVQVSDENTKMDQMPDRDFLRQMRNLSRSG